MDFENIDTQEISAAAFSEVNAGEARALESEIVEVPGIGEVLVGGRPFEVADHLDDNQGDNILNAQGDCGVVSVVNLARMAGIECSEDDAIVKAVQLRLCTYSTDLAESDNGGTNVYQRQALLGQYGIPSTVFWGTELNPEQIAQLAEAGHGVNLGVNCGYEWGDIDYVNDGSSNHSIVVTGTARDPDTHELLGLFVCDSGYPGKTNAAFISVDTLNDAYTNAYGSSALVTNDPIRA